jgi:hypothetical protein
MKQSRLLASAIFAAVTLACLANVVAGQTASEGTIATVTGGGTSARWDITAANSGGTLTISLPDGRSVRQTFRAGTSPQINLGEKHLENPPDGVYVYELRLSPANSAALKDAATKARGKDDDPESERAGRKRPSVPALIQSGSFAVVNGSIIVAGAVEPEQKREPKASTGPTAAPATRATASDNLLQRIRNNHRAFFKPDFVIADDLVVQGSACVGLDCVNNEPFSFDTIRMKENNTRILFMDTSVGAFPTNDWMIRANSSASGGGSFLAFVDQGTTSTGGDTGTIIFEVDAGAPANSLRVSSTGNIGLGTATPVLDVHANTSDTPAIRLEQNNSGGFSAQTWDIAGNEANFFVRDVTSGSRLPFRIRPGAPTSSIDISADGDVGIGTAGPNARLDIKQSTDDFVGGLHLRRPSTNDTWAIVTGNDNNLYMGYATDASLANAAADFTVVPLVVTANNRVGIRTTSPDQALSVNGDASKTGGNTWLAFSDERLKTIKGRFNTGLKAVMQLQPIRYEYLKVNALGLKSEGEHIGFGAQTLQKIIPEAVTKNGDGYLMVNSDPIIWTMLNAIKEQQQQIAELKAEVRKLQTATRRRRR